MRRICTGLFVGLSLLILCLLLIIPAARVHSFVLLDPTRIISSLVTSNRLRRVLPAYLERDLRILQDVCSADVLKVDIFRRELLIANFTIHHASQSPQENLSTETDAAARSTNTDSPALRVGFANVSWQSYIRPCITLKLSEVDILVEFTNLFLSRTNWHELREKGFPPELLVGSVADDGIDASGVSYNGDAGAEGANIVEEGTASTVSSSYVRVEGLELSGNVTLRVVSRPLGGEDIVPPFVFGLEALNDLSEQIQREANAEAGRRGCTTDRAYDIVQQYFLRKLQQVLASTAFDISLLGKDASSIQRTQKILSSAEDIVKKYASSVSELAEDKAKDRLRGLQRKVLEGMRTIGLDDGQVEAARLGSKSIAKQTAGLLKSAFRDRVAYRSNADGKEDEIDEEVEL